MLNSNGIRLARIKVYGVAQGVGFRPFIYRIALANGLKGKVYNDSGYVHIDVEGAISQIEKFVTCMRLEAPPAAHIENVEVRFLPPVGYSSFSIEESRSTPGEYQPVSPDLATCDECLKEILDPENRRHYYPFTNCTHCGPRFTIIEDMPYDRHNTTMREFTMCPECHKEYENPTDRRFHAQPVACPACGPRLWLTDGKEMYMEGRKALTKTAELLKSGAIIAIRGLGGFQLACDATNLNAVRRLRARKNRPDKPFAVMFNSIEKVMECCLISPAETSLLQSAASPIVLLQKKEGSTCVCESVAPGLRYLGVMLPYTPLHHLLLRETGIPLVMTSGNLSEEPIAKDNEEALSRLHRIADYYLMHNRGISSRYDDSVTLTIDNSVQIIRRARGYSPFPITLPYNARQVLACGGQEKNTFCLTRGHHAFVSQHIGDMENEETLEHFRNTLDIYIKLFRINPEIVACDMHPEYISTKFARDFSRDKGLNLVPVQHHHAHIVSCMVENGVKSPVIGVAFDGTGYGTDGTIWGGEFLISEWGEFRRIGHLESVPLPGGIAAIKKPYRMALSYVFSLLGKDTPLEGMPLAQYSDEYVLINRQIERGINSPLTSSAGRLFDAVSALLGFTGQISYEAQAATYLETLASGNLTVKDHYPVIISEKNSLIIVKLGIIFNSILQDIWLGVSAPEIALKFHITIAEIIRQMCKIISQRSGIGKVALSGGVFQNRLLQSYTLNYLTEEKFEVFIHHQVPCNDGGISLGQAVIADNTHIF